MARPTTGAETLLGIGEAKWNDVMGVGHLERLRHIRTLLTTRGTATEATRLHFFSGAGFTDELHQLAENDPAIQLTGLTRLYHGE
ncbi:hypothetical protein [Streptomyces sp. NPDC046909]|uniref:hypothetical protein n=1 Tax=Streptomyces sp. NPDC046909 TaxID=3155617 RepID=UPI0033C297DA